MTMTGNNVEAIAQVCHAATRAYSATQGNKNVPGWDNLPTADREDVKRRVTSGFEQLERGTLQTLGASGPAEGADSTNEMIFMSILRGFYDTQPAATGT